MRDFFETVKDFFFTALDAAGDFFRRKKSAVPSAPYAGASEKSRINVYFHGRSPGEESFPEPEEKKPNKGLLWAFHVLLGLGVIGSLLFCFTVLGEEDGRIRVSLSVDGQERQLKMWPDTVEELIIAAGVTLQEQDHVSRDLTETLQDGDRVEITRAFPVSVLSGGKSTTLYMTGGTVGDALALANAEVDADDEISHLRFEDVKPGMQIEHSQVEVSYTTSHKTLYYQDETIKDSSLYTEVKKVEVKGENGVKQVTQRVITRNGVVVSKEVVDQTVLKEAVNQVTRVGTKIHYQTNYVGETRLYKKAPKAGVDGWVEMTVYRATAYCTGTKTATGTKPELGTIAVNPKFIPYGSEIYVKGYGYGVARDTGAFRNYEPPRDTAIDLWFNTEKEALRWGAKYNMTILVRFK